MSKFSERLIVAILCQWSSALKHLMWVSNCYAFGEEADFLSVTKAGRAWEFEIKTSRSDFFADARKRRNQNIDLGFKNRGIKSGRNHFCYVVPCGLVVLDEVPEWAGLMYVYESECGSYYWPKNMCSIGGVTYEFSIVKRPPLLHKNGATEFVKNKIAQSLSYRLADALKKEYDRKP